MRHLIYSYLNGLKTSPGNTNAVSLWLIAVYSLIATVIGFSANLFSPGIVKVETPFLFILPITLFLFPSFLEESFFRGILIPNDVKSRNARQQFFYISLSTSLFILWHPLNALTINRRAIDLFLNPYFLTITGLLGLTCSLTYIQSRSLWVPVFIHWTTVFVWVIFLGGRNRILEL